MSITKLMQDQKAAAIYASLDTHIHPATIADDHLQAKLAGDKSLALALECFARDLARMHFNRPEVLDCLARVERQVKMRKMGTGAPKMLQEIADAITADYAAGNFETLADGRIKFRIYHDGGEPRLNLKTGKFSPAPHLAVTCENMPGAVALVAAKYRRGMPKSRSGRYGTNNAIVN